MGGGDMGSPVVEVGDLKSTPFQLPRGSFCVLKDIAESYRWTTTCGNRPIKEYIIVLLVSHYYRSHPLTEILNQNIQNEKYLSINSLGQYWANPSSPPQDLPPPLGLVLFNDVFTCDTQVWEHLGMVGLGEGVIYPHIFLGQE